MSTPAEPCASDLTSRQIEVMSLIAQGYTWKRIAIKLSISPRTVEKHVVEVKLQLRARNATHAAVLFDRRYRQKGEWPA